ncbi:MAG: hypothetical protein K5880_13885 [Hydrogenophaga sp.]|uniref:hypothetical protein n=1 Tax=Hydrogenophaga sp. TaxID=1904254 RepID=UPI0026258E7E|nr:hypothetical protein [Hydrogenophaga sp.]MCV0439712.1 hypothetical protein [Hydrogenophaga sp.]
MRKDMKDVLVTPGRNGKWDGARKTQPTDDVDRLDNLPQHEGMKRRWAEGGWGWSFGDHINPLRKWLKKHVGRPFDKVYSEFCEHADARNLRGWHAREHFWMEVDTHAERLAALEHRWKWPSQFYVDEHGILREDERGRRWRRRDQEKDPDKCKVGDRLFERINGCWFEVWYEDEELSRKVWSWALQRKVVEYYSKEVKVCQRQLSKKALRDLGLSNSPHFKWWEA